MSVLIAQIGFHAVGSVPIAHGIGMLDPEIVIIVAAYAMLCVLGILLGIWAAMRDKPTLWRFAGVVAAIVAIICLQKMPGFEFVSGIEELAFLLLFTVIATSLSLFIGRAAGVRIAHIPRSASSKWGRIKTIRRKEGLKETDSASTEPPKLQFSLGSLISWTTAFAVLLCSFSTLRAVVPSCVPSGADSWMAVVVGIAVSSPIVLVILWIALSDRWLVARIVVPVLGILIIALLATPRGLGSRFLENVFLSVCMLGVMAIVLIGTLRVFRRLTGYCLVWRKPAVWSLFRGTRRRTS